MAMDFSKILDRGKKMFDVTHKGGKWNVCEECNKRKLCYAYLDVEGEIWWLCEVCTQLFIKECE